MKTFFERYFVNGFRAVAHALFATLIISNILVQISKIPQLGFLNSVAAATSVFSPIIGCAIGIAVANSLGAKTNVLVASALTGFIGFELGGPLGAAIGAAVGAELGSLISDKVRSLDLFLSPLITIVSGGLVAIFVCPYISKFTAWLGDVTQAAASLSPVLMGLTVAVLAGLFCSTPLTAAAILASVDLGGIAAGAACIGCCCHMFGFAAASFKDCGIWGSAMQGLGGSVLQFPNIIKRPQILLAPTLASAVLGPVSVLVGMTNSASGAAFGSCAFIGQLAAFNKMGFDLRNAVLVLLLHIVLPIALTLVFDLFFRRIGWVKKGYMQL